MSLVFNILSPNTITSVWNKSQIYSNLESTKQYPKEWMDELNILFKIKKTSTSVSLW